MDLKKTVQRLTLGTDREVPMPEDWAGRAWYCLRYHYFLLFCMNLLFLVSCLPLVTIPASCTALSAVTAGLTRGKPVAAWRMYWQEWKQDFGKRLVLWLLMCLVPLSAGFYAQLLGLEQQGTGTRLLALALVFLVQQYWYPCMALIRVSPWQNLKNAVILAALARKKSICLLLTVGILYAACLLFPLYSFPIMVLCLFSLGSVLTSALVAPEVLAYLGRGPEQRKE